MREYISEHGGMDTTPERAGRRTYRDGSWREVFYLDDGRKVVRWHFEEVA